MASKSLYFFSEIFVIGFGLKYIFSNVLHELYIVDFYEALEDVRDYFFRSNGFQLAFQIFFDALDLEGRELFIDFFFFLHLFLNFNKGVLRIRIIKCREISSRNIEKKMNEKIKSNELVAFLILVKTEE